MSVSKWAYDPDTCDGDFCPGDCDYCDSSKVEKALNNSDLISRADAIEALRGLFDMRKSRAKVIVECFGELLDALPSAEAVSRKAKCCPIAETCMSIDCPVSSEYIGIPSADAVPQLRQTDTLIIADALRYLAQDTERHLADRTRADALRQQFLKYGASMCHSAEAVQGYTEWLEKIIVDAETVEWLCEDTPCKEWCDDNCHYSSIQAECLRHLYEVSKGGDDE